MALPVWTACGKCMVVFSSSVPFYLKVDSAAAVVFDEGELGNHLISDCIIKYNLKSLAVPMRWSLLLLSHRGAVLKIPEIIPGISGNIFTAKWEVQGASPGLGAPLVHTASPLAHSQTLLSGRGELRCLDTSHAVTLGLRASESAPAGFI